VAAPGFRLARTSNPGLLAALQIKMGACARCAAGSEDDPIHVSFTRTQRKSTPLP